MIFRQKLENFQFHTEAIATVSRLKASRESFCAFRDKSHDCLTRKKHVFLVLYSRCDSFSNSPHFPRTASLEPLSTQNQILLRPHHFQAKISTNSLQGMFF